MVRLSQDGVSGGEANEAIEGLGALWGPDKGYAFLQEIQKRASDVREVGDEGAVVSEDSQGRSYFFNGLQYAGPFGDARNLTRIDAEGFAVKQESQVFYTCLFEGTLLGFEKEGFLFEEIEDIMHNLSMEGGVVRSSDQDVVHVDEDHIRVLEFERSEDAVHYVLEGCRGVALPE